jgi:hypothetical protein
MKKTIINSTAVATTALLSLPITLFAQGAGAITTSNDLSTYLQSVISFVNAVIIPFLLAIGFLFFVWGMFRYFIVGATNEDARENGKSVIVYSVLGFILIIVFWGVVNILADATGLDGIEFDGSAVPDAPDLDDV